MELRCPECASPEVEHDPGGGGEAHRCGSCGARFPRGAALITVLEAEAYRGATSPLFTFNPRAAAAELRKGDGAILSINPYSDADELNALLDGAQALKIIESERGWARLYVYPLSLGEPEPLLAVDPGAAETLLGHSLALRQREGEDPVTFTIRFLAEAVEEANGLAAGRAADSDCLDRIAAFLNRPGQWNGRDVCEYVAAELRESGRRLEG